MDERLKFIARLLDGEKMAVVCRAFGISRKTGYKILTRYNAIGLDGLTDRSRRPYRHANQLPVQIETQIVRLKQDKPSWGAPKIREKLARLYPDVHTPAISTVHAVLDRHGLVKRRAGRRHRAKGTPLSLPGQPNDLWCADYKGEFMLADRRYCYPLTITDFASRSPPPRKPMLSPCLRPFSRSTVCPRPSAPTMVFLSQAPMPSSG
jgi:putative transposase